MEAHRVGRSPRAHRQADEGRPRRQLRREERAGPDRNTCTYCSVGCGLIMYSQGDGAKNVAQNIIHI
ncbi:hypothetical protein ED860_19935, partial [Acinetobacter baumannii]